MFLRSRPKFKQCFLIALMAVLPNYSEIDRLQSTPSWLTFRTHGKQKASILNL